MAIDPQHIKELVSTAGRRVGVQELLRAGGFNPGVQTELKRVLRELVKQGELVRDGKRFGLPDEQPKQKSGPAWGGKKPTTVRALAPRAPAPRQPSRGKARADAALAAPAPRAKAGASGRTVAGIIHHHRDGFAFVKPLVGETSDDLFIPPDEARKALDHDQVLVEVLPGRDGRSMGRIVQVTSRTRQKVVGTYFESARGAWVEPREAELGHIRVPKTQLARPGDAVKVTLGVGESNFADAGQLTGEVSGSLGSEADHSVEVLSVAFAKGFHDEFPPEVMAEADAIGLEVRAHEATEPGRRDLRALPLITIDGEDARDFDDAVFCEAHPKGWRLVVAIADVSHYVREDTALNAEGLRRATSVYLPGRVLPMLPERLSNGICSLKPDVDRLCMVADLVIDRRGATIGTELYPAVMKSHARCTYTEVHRVLNGEDVPGRTALRGQFERLHTLAKTLTAMRLERGAVDFDLPEQKVELGDDGLPVRLVKRERWESHRLVEECMLAANEAVARFFREQELPTVNRFHGNPDEDRLDMFLTLLGAYGIEVPPGDFTSSSLNAVLKQLEGHPEQRALNQLALRSMMQAVYSSRQAGHYGLGALDYLHFTSPIRRYPDLLVHRLLKKLWGRGGQRPSPDELEAEEEQLEALSVQCSERERAAMQVEREVNQLYSCLLLKDRVGEEHEGAVCGLSDNGFFVQLDELWVEGFVRGDGVYPDFEFEQATYRLQFGNGQVVKVGQRCKVQIAGVNLDRKQIDFEVLELDGEGVEAPEAAAGEARPRGRGRASGKGRPEQAPRGGRFGAREERGARAGGRPQSGGRFGRAEAKGAGERGGRSGGRPQPGGRFVREETGSPSRSRGEGRVDRGGRFGARAESGGQTERGGEARGGRFGAPAETGGRSGGRTERGAEGRGGRFGGREKAGGRFGRDEKGSRAGGARGGGDARREAPGGRFGSRFGPGRFARDDAPTFGRLEPRDEKQHRRSPQPPPQPWDRKADEASDEPQAAQPTRFDAREVLDRLWKQRGGGGGGRR